MSTALSGPLRTVDRRPFHPRRKLALRRAGPRRNFLYRKEAVPKEGEKHLQPALGAAFSPASGLAFEPTLVLRVLERIAVVRLRPLPYSE